MTATPDQIVSRGSRLSAVGVAAFVLFGLTGAVRGQDLLLDNVRVVTGTGEAWTERSIVARGGRIVPAGTAATADAERVDLAGRGWVFPGLVDAHGHLAGLGRSIESVNVVGTTSFAEVIERVQERAANTPRGEWIIGRGWDQNDWPDQRMPEHDELSAAVPDHPVVLTRIDGHALLANLAAMQAAEVGRGTESPDGGEILRASGIPTGVFVDRAMGLIHRAMPRRDPAVVEQELLLAQAECLKFGLTCVHDAGIPPDEIAILRRLHTEGRWALRVYAMLPASAEDAIRQGPWQTPDDVITVRAVKGYVDGALGSRGAALLEPYADRPGSRGLLITPQAGVEKLAQLCADHGFQLCVHAIGDRANRTVLDAYASVEHPGGDSKAARFRIEHAQIVHPDDFARFAELGVVPSMQPTHLTSDMPWAPARLGSERIPGAYAWRRFLDLGVRLPFGSDFPVEAADPRHGWYAAATTRQPWSDGPELRPEQKLSRSEILRRFTADAAWAAFQERDLGVIEPGKYADFTVFDRDLTTCDDEDLLRAEVLLTVIGGEVVYRSPSLMRRLPVSANAERVASTLEYLSSDELAGRNSPSRGLDLAANYIASAFASVGLEPLGDEGTYFQRFTIEGVEFDSADVQVEVLAGEGAPPQRLVAGEDVRVWRPGRAFDAREGTSRVVPMQRLRRSRSTEATFMVASPDAPAWKDAVGTRHVVSGRLGGSPPVLLVREGVLEPGDVRTRISIPAGKPTELPLRNLVAHYPGGDLAEEFVLVTAHYDHIGVGAVAGEDAIFNGADDNATGTTAVVAIARNLAGSNVQLRRSVLFVCFAAEEKGLRGSRAFVANSPVPLDKIAAVVNIEMIGRPPENARHKAWITGVDLSDFGQLARPALAKSGIELIGFDGADRLFEASDNYPFALKGVVAHSISAGELHRDYHGVGDEFEKIDIEHMVGVIEGIREVVLELANRDAKPVFNEAGRKRLDLK